ncbi:protein-L-isoaspartate(D-aspartate) O-methyltransferase [Sphingobacteriales bacterium CHB3]|nr:protein-L-isoaspartate(D-aspartate) O-methyltransferase [Sphingobacteriales bacterium CHB3]
MLGRFDDEMQEMISLLKDRGISDSRLLRSMSTVKRHLFVPEPFTSRAYEDSALPIGKQQTISQPYTVAFMTQALGVKPDDKVLEIGTGSGYQAAVLAEMGARVFTIERHAELLSGARKLFDRLNYRIASKAGDGTVGWNEFAPFNGIIVTAGAPDVPEPLMKQLDNGGKLVIPVGDLDFQTLIVVTRLGEKFERKEIHGFKFVPLIGKMGWSR